MKRISTSITVSIICPRNKNVELTQTIDAVNAVLQCLCSDESLTFTNNDPAFHLADGTINDGHFLQDGIHLTHKATERLPKNLNLVLERPEKSVNKQNTTQTGKPAAAPLNVKKIATHDAMDVSAAFWKHAREKARQPIPRQVPTPRRETTGNQHQHQRRQQSTVTSTSSTPLMTTTSIVTANTATGHATTVAKSTTTRSGVVTATG